MFQDLLIFNIKMIKLSVILLFISLILSGCNENTTTISSEEKIDEINEVARITFTEIMKEGGIGYKVEWESDKVLNITVPHTPYEDSKTYAEAMCRIAKTHDIGNFFLVIKDLKGETFGASFCKNRE